MKILNDVQANVVYYDSDVLQNALTGLGALTGLNANTIQDAIDILFRLVLPLINFVGGAPSTPDNQFLVILDGGAPNTTEFVDIIDGGTPSG